jgi:hypothetical protein
MNRRHVVAADEEVSYVVYRVSTGVTDRPGHLRGDASSVR